jgi:hypothetical protein
MDTSVRAQDVTGPTEDVRRMSPENVTVGTQRIPPA